MWLISVKNKGKKMTFLKYGIGKHLKVQLRITLETFLHGNIC